MLVIAADPGSYPLSRMDRALLAYQQASDATPLSVAYLLRAAGACDLATLRASVEKRAARFSPLAYRVTPTMGGWPRWAPDAWFDARSHVRELHLPAGSGESAVRTLVARRCQRPIPLDVPPWELCLLRAPGAATFYVLFRASHLWLDGTALHQVLTVLFGTDLAQVRWLREKRVTAGSVAAAGVRLLGWAAPTASLDALVRPPAGNHEVHWASTSTERLRAVGRAHGATVNDVFLAALAGALDGWSRPVAGSRRLRVLMPVSARRPGEADSLGNFVVGTRIALPRGQASAERRFAAIGRQTARYRRRGDAGAGERWWFERIPSRYGRAAVALGMNPRRVAISTSNLGALPASLTIVGNPVIEAVPVPIPVPGQRMFVILGGLGSTATVGVAVDSAVPGGATLATRWLAELDALDSGRASTSAVSRRRAGPRRRSTSRSA
jgi:diacylglycerol O-acyltransferase / wax synthase